MTRLLLSTLLFALALSARAEEQPGISLAEPVTLTTARNIQLRLIDEGYNDLWQRLRGGFSLQDQNAQLVAKHEQWYASRPGYVARMMSRANRYLFYITAEVERRGMPAEIALLPMIESAFNPGAYSTSSASGIWQFIPSTGKNFGMRQNWWYDGRRDIVGATNGALDYLEKLHGIFGDWELALAAYNWGDGAVQRAQMRNRKLGLPVDYAHLTLPDETRNYLPKLIAMRNIVTNPERYNLKLPAIPNKPYFARVPTTKHIDVKLAAELADITQEEFVALNPAHNRPVILQDNSDYVLLPIDKVETFRANLQSYDMPLVSWQLYHAKKGERLDHLAPRFGLSLERLKEVNSLSARAKVCDEETLLVPIGGDEQQEEGEFEPVNMHLHPAAPGPGPSLKYTVHSGDTLDKLASRYHVSVAALKSWNGELKQVRVGQTLNLAKPKHQTEAVHVSSHVHGKHADGRNPAKQPVKRAHRRR